MCETICNEFQYFLKIKCRLKSSFLSILDIKKVNVEGHSEPGEVFFCIRIYHKRGCETLMNG